VPPLIANVTIRVGALSNAGQPSITVVADPTPSRPRYLYRRRPQRTASTLRPRLNRISAITALISPGPQHLITRSSAVALAVLVTARIALWLAKPDLLDGTRPATLRQWRFLMSKYPAIQAFPASDGRLGASLSAFAM